METKDIRPGARFRICGTVSITSTTGREIGSIPFCFDNDFETMRHIYIYALQNSEFVSPPPVPKLTPAQSALIRERLEAGDLADVLDSLTE